MLTYRAYRFPDAATAERILDTYQPAAIDVIGIAYEPVEYEDWKQQTEPVALPGWWVNVVWDCAAPSELQEYEVPPSAAPRWWAGVPTASPPPVPLTAEQVSEIVQGVIDATARAKGYRDGVSCASYVSSTVEQWAREAAEFVAWRDAVWAAVFAHAERGEVAYSPSDVLSRLPRTPWARDES